MKKLIYELRHVIAAKFIMWAFNIMPDSDEKLSFSVLLQAWIKTNFKANEQD